jgi:NAD(P)-dependent dehydrogenase (short-subunit alcohol dehydrogenase family)
MQACIFGASGGLGSALVRNLAASGDYDRVFACSRKPTAIAGDDKVRPLAFDLTDEASIAAVAETTAHTGPVDLVIVATGILHRAGEIDPEKSWSALDTAVMATMFALNCTGPALIAKHMLPKLAQDRRSVFAALSARVGSITDNRLGGWHSYRASKAALNMMVRNFAIELGRRNPAGIAVALHPGTVDTRLSEPYQRNVASGTLMAPDRSAGHIVKVIAGLDTGNSGGFYAWDGHAIAF